MALRVGATARAAEMEHVRLGWLRWHTHEGEVSRRLPMGPYKRDETRSGCVECRLM